MAIAMGTVAIAEAIGGYVTGSLALMADAAHALTDVLSLILALLATHLVAKSVESPKKSFGYYRAEILAAFANAVFLGVLGVFIIIEAVERSVDPVAVDGGHTAIFAGIILGIEMIGAFVLYRLQGESLNMRSAFVHLMGDMVSTVGVLLSGLAIAFLGAGYLWLDPAVSIGIALLLGFWAIRLIQETAHILMEGTPYEIDLDEVRRSVEGLDGIKEVHDLHVWTLTSGFHTMSAHVVADHCDPMPELGARVRTAVYDAFGLGHVTIQIEDPCNRCEGPHA